MFKGQRVLRIIALAGIIVMAGAGLSFCLDGESLEDTNVFHTGGADVSIINIATLHSVKRTVQVRLSQRVSEDTLRTIANKLYVPGYDRTFILYLLAGMKVGEQIAWATTHFNPNLEIKVLGLTPTQLETLVALPSSSKPSPQELIGKWIWELPYGSSNRITIYKRNGNVYYERAFLDGSGSVEIMIERASRQGRRFEDEELNDYGDYYLLDKHGDLFLGDTEGIFEKLQKIDGIETSAAIRY